MKKSPVRPLSGENSGNSRSGDSKEINLGNSDNGSPKNEESFLISRELIERILRGEL